MATAAPSTRGATLSQSTSLHTRWAISKKKMTCSTYAHTHTCLHDGTMFSSLGMNHDGERQEGNNCDPDKFLMSPILGPGKVTWSSCSNNELEQFLDGRWVSA